MTDAKRRGPRPAASYRGARRNAFHGSVWPAPQRRYVPHLVKPDTFKIRVVAGVPVPVRIPRKQPRVYPGGWRSRAERAAS